MIARLTWPDAATQATLVRLLGGDAVVVLPTDTLYGFSARAASELALARIATLKGRHNARSFVALAAHPADVWAGSIAEPRVVAFLTAVWPAPLTVVLRTAVPVPWGEVRNGVPTAAYRVPAHPALRGLLAAVGEPVVSTSVNRSGQAPLLDAESIQREFGAEVAAIVIDPGLERRPAQASTLGDFTAWPPRTLRPGAFDLDAALAAWPLT